jgi:Type III secretion system lipoprotein chaperone (YscW)
VTIIDGILSFPSAFTLRDVAGIVRLEDVSLADAPSVSIATARFAADDAERPIPFRLTAREPVRVSQDYAVTAEAAATDAATGRRRQFGTTAAIVWRPDGPPSPVAVQLKPWT